MESKMFFVLLITLNVNHFVRSEPTPAFNEMSITCPNTADCDYIEIKLLSTKDDTENKSLANIYIYGIGFEENYNDSYYKIDLIIDLSNQRTSSNGFFTIGMSEAPGVMLLNASSDNVQWEKKLENPGILLDMIPDANEHPRMLIIVETQSPFKLTKDSPSIRVDGKVKNSLKGQMKDAILYNSQSVGESCSFFDDLLSNFTANPIILRENDHGTGIDTTLSRCSSTLDRYDHQNFEWTLPSPMLIKNKCRGFQLDYGKYMDIIYNPVDSQDDSKVKGCKSQQRPEAVRAISPNNVKELFYNLTILTDHSCPMISSNLYIGNDELHRRIDLLKMKIRNNSLNADDLTPSWEKDDHFDKNWLKQIKDDPYLSQVIDLKIFDEITVRRWFTFDYKPGFLHQSTYQCRICHGFHDFDRGTKPKPADPTVFHPDKYVNKRNIINHHNSRGHLQAIKKLQKGFYELIDGMMIKSEKDDPDLIATVNLMFAIYSEIRMNIPAISHPKLMELLSLMEVHIGSHHQRRQSASIIIQMMSDHFHDRLLKYLIANDYPITIIMDSSTDTSMHHTMIVYFQMIEKNRPVVMFYRLMELGSDGKAATIVAKLIQHFRDDGILERMKKLMIGFSSDGENLMLGSTGGVAVLLTREIGFPLFVIHCSAHRLALVATQGLKKKDGVLENLEKGMNKVYAFYHSSAKRTNHLKEMADELGINYVMLSQYKKIRWTAAELKAMKKVLNNWKLLNLEMKREIDDPNTDESTKQTARDLTDFLRNKNVVLYLHFFEDILSDIADYSVQFQSRIGLVIDKHSILKNLKSTLATVSTRALPKMTKFIEKCKCGETGCTGIEQYLFSNNVKCFDIKLANDIYVEPFNEFRQAASAKLVDRMDHWFPEGDLADFNALDPDYFPTTRERLQNYGNIEIGRLATRFRVSPATVIEWQQLVEIIFNDREICEWKKAGIVPFWKHYLDEYGQQFNELTWLIRCSLTLSFSSAESERGFSTTNWLRSGREGFSVAGLEHRLRVYLNGPDVLIDFPAKVIAKKWLKSHSRADDPYPLPEPKGASPNLLPQNTIINGDD